MYTACKSTNEIVKLSHAISYQEGYLEGCVTSYIGEIKSFQTEK